MLQYIIFHGGFKHKFCLLKINTFYKMSNRYFNHTSFSFKNHFEVIKPTKEEEKNSYKN